MTLIIETNFKKNKKTVETLSVALPVDQLTEIVKTKGLNVANNAIDKFVAKYTADLKAKIASVLNS
ncbi:MAG: hypothetical protein EBU90_22955 [Proteobacteria bacterium]|nr:hypothetical protein [Pseudomonadota bacterium]NBP15640.1 hypothetical protein [bacterium]